MHSAVISCITALNCKPVITAVITVHLLFTGVILLYALKIYVLADGHNDDSSLTHSFLTRSDIASRTSSLVLPVSS